MLGSGNNEFSSLGDGKSNLWAVTRGGKAQIKSRPTDKKVAGKIHSVAKQIKRVSSQSALLAALADG